MHTQDDTAGLRFDLRLLIRHPRLDPEFVSSQLGLRPNITQMAGDPRKALKGTPLGGTYADSRWGWSARFDGKREFFDEVAALVQRLYPHREFLSQVTDSGGHLEIIVHLPGDTNIGWTMPWEELATLAELKINLGVEVFPHFQ